MYERALTVMPASPLTPARPWWKKEQLVLETLFLWSFKCGRGVLFLFYRLSGTPGVAQIPSEAFLPPLAARAAVTLTHSSFSKLVKREEKTNIHTFYIYM